VRASILLFAASLTLAGAAWFGCGQKSSATNGDDAGTPPDSATSDAASAATCPPCVTDKDCNGGVCAQLGSDSYCAPACPNGNECSADRACTPVSTASGAQASVCVPRGGGDCSNVPDQDAGPPPATCGALVGPDVKASCASCGGANTCQANGCYNGWWCNTATSRCQAPPNPADCVPPDGGVPWDGGGPVTGNVGPDGGQLSRLLFAVVGDTRPATIDDTQGYPSPIIDAIFTDIEKLSAKPPFVLSTGDYMFASTSNAQAVNAQLDLYLSARGNYSGVTFPAMGNHECTGATASNCGSGNVDGVTANYSAFLAKMLQPIGQTDPYYAIRIDALDKSWTSKFVFIAANAWTSAQATWLDQQLSQATTYTFVVRHEPSAANTAPGVTPSDQILAAHPYTLSIVGHTHTYEHFAGREVVIGNGGAPLTGNKNYGFGIFNQRPDGAIQVDMIDYQSGNAVGGYFHFAVKPDGTATP
jgi:hypothetical protein